MGFVGEVHEFLGHLLLEKELRVKRLQLRRAAFSKFLRLRGVALRPLGDLSIMSGQLGAHFLHLPAEPRQLLHVALAALDFLVEDDAVETLAALGKLGREIEVRLRHEAETVDVLLHHLFRFFDALGNLHFLLAGEQRHLAHLLEIHPHRIVEDVELRLGLLLLFVGVFLAVLETIDLRRLDDVDLELAQPHQDVIELVRIGQLLGQRFVEIVESEIALLLGQLDQLANARLGLARSIR